MFDRPFYPRWLVQPRLTRRPRLILCRLCLRARRYKAHQRRRLELGIAGVLMLLNVSSLIQVSTCFFVFLNVMVFYSSSHKCTIKCAAQLQSWQAEKLRDSLFGPPGKHILCIYTIPFYQRVSSWALQFWHVHSPQVKSAPPTTLAVEHTSTAWHNRCKWWPGMYLQ